MGIKAPLVKIYDTAEDRMDTALGNKISNDKIRMWQCIRVARNDYEKNECHGYYEPTTKGYTDSFDKWVKETCGMEIFFDETGYISGRVDIVDEAKYAWCLLKYK